MIIIVDSDGLIGSLNPNDVHYPTLRNILTELVSKDVTFLYPTTVIVESVTFLQGRLNKPILANEVVQRVNQNQLNIEPVDAELLQKACLLMNLKGSKHNTLFDAIVVAIAQKYNADAIFSFDKFYKSKGLKLVSELIRS